MLMEPVLNNTADNGSLVRVFGGRGGEKDARGGREGGGTLLSACVGECCARRVEEGAVIPVCPVNNARGECFMARAEL